MAVTTSPRALVGTAAIAVLVAAVLTAVLLRDASLTEDVTAGPPTPVPTAAAPAPRPSLLPDDGVSGPVPTAPGLQRSLASALVSPRLGPRVAVSVVDVATGRVLLDRGAGRPVVPASTLKIATGVAALVALPPDLRLSTRVVAGSGGDVVVVGGGDPTLAPPGARPRFPRPARLTDLAAQVRAALKGSPVRRVVVDDRMFRGPRTGPGWKPVYLSDGDVAPVSALELQGVDVADPALDAGKELARLLGAKAVVRGAAPAGAAQLARVSSPPVPELVEDMLLRSDNDLAEALGRHVALARGLPPTFEGASAAVASAVQPFVGPGGLALRDTSGLSPLNRVRPAALTRLLALAAARPELGAVVTGLPVGGFSGTLQDRFRASAATRAAGVVRGKTGTLTGVSALAGLVRTRSGRLLAFDLVADAVPGQGNSRAQAALDEVAAVLASCGCR